MRVVLVPEASIQLNQNVVVYQRYSYVFVAAAFAAFCVDFAEQVEFRSIGCRCCGFRGRAGLGFVRRGRLRFDNFRR